MSSITPSFLITMDAEGDNLWQNPRSVSTRNAEYLSRFQSLCESFGFKTTWLTNYEMALSPIFVKFANDLVERDTGEIGMHLHAWDSPPNHPIDEEGQSYLTEYPASIMERKIRYMTRLLRDTFDHPIRSHRAGRWGFNAEYARILMRYGYDVDTSVTPYVNWRATPGRQNGEGGPDYGGFPALPYFLDPEDISRPGSSGLLEIPVTIVPAAADAEKINWLRPDGENLDAMIRIVDLAVSEEWPCIVFMLHSSELMPGGSPRFGTERDIENLYAHLDVLFESVSSRFKGATLAEEFKKIVDC